MPHEDEDILKGFLTEDERGRLLENGARRQQALSVGRTRDDLPPLVLLVTPDAGCLWLLASLDPADPDIAYGVCDLGTGYPELATFSLSELAALRGRRGLPVERLGPFIADKTISEYEKEGRMRGYVEV